MMCIVHDVWDLLEEDDVEIAPIHLPVEDFAVEAAGDEREFDP